MITERLELLQELVPGLHRLAVIVRNDPGLDQKLQDIRSEARRKWIEPLMLEATTGKAPELAFARLRGDLCEAIYVASGPLGPAKRSRIIALAEEARLPVIYSFRILTATVHRRNRGWRTRKSRVFVISVYHLVGAGDDCGRYHHAERV